MATAPAPGSVRPGARGFVRQVAEDLIRIERIAAGGDGVGRLPDGRVAFVPRTAPGDLARCEVTRPAARFVRARLVAVEEPGPDRVEPACAHYTADQCGGCQLQHLSASAQRAARRTIVGDALRRIARLAVEDPPVESASDDWGYRAKVALSTAPGRRIGYHRYDRPGQVFDLVRCPIAAPGINGLLERIRAARRALPDRLERATLRLDRSGGEHLILATGAGPVWAGGRALHGAVRGDGPLTVWWQPEGGAARAVAGSTSAYPATAFEQVNPAMGDRVRRRALERLGPVAEGQVWDLYAGIGEASEALAAAGATVASVESDGSAVSEAARRQVAFGRRIDRIQGRVEDVVASLPVPDRVILNPPRAGLDGRVVTVLLARAPGRIVYVSCDPATLARDLGRLAASGSGYRLASLETFDLFPQTAHVETVALLERV